MGKLAGFMGAADDSQSPIVIETGKKISVRATGINDATNYEQGHYKFTDFITVWTGR